MKIDIIIPNFNSSEILIKNLPAIIDSLKNYKDSHVIIVDDASDEENFNILKNYLEQNKSKKLILVRKNKNQGFSSTVNTGVNKSEADIVVFLNSDVTPENDFLEKAVEHLRNNPLLFGVGCLDKSIEDGKEVLRGRGEAWWEKGFLRHKKAEIKKSDTFWISGGSSIVRRDFFKKLGGFDEIYNPFYWEDIDLSYRARKSGYKILFEKNCVVTHRHSKGSIKSNFTDEDIKTIAFRNEIIFVWKNITDIKMLISNIIHLKLLFFKSLLLRDRIVIIGTLKAIGKIPDIISQRMKQKKLYKVPDSQLIPVR